MPNYLLIAVNSYYDLKFPSINLQTSSSINFPNLSNKLSLLNFTHVHLCNTHIIIIKTVVTSLKFQHLHKTKHHSAYIITKSKPNQNPIQTKQNISVVLHSFIQNKDNHYDPHKNSQSTFFSV